MVGVAWKRHWNRIGNVLGGRVKLTVLDVVMDLRIKNLVETERASEEVIFFYTDR